LLFVPASLMHHRWQDEVCRPPSESLVRGHTFTICDTVCAIPHSHLSEDTRSHMCRFVALGPWPVQKPFIARHMQQGRSKPGCQIVWSATSDWLTTVANSQESHHASFKLDDAMKALRWMVTGQRCHCELATFNVSILVQKSIICFRPL